MIHNRYRSVAEQVAQVLRDGLREGRWKGTMPGRFQIAEELGVNPKTANAALKILEAQGCLVARGQGRGREIVSTQAVNEETRLRVRILLYEQADIYNEHIVGLNHQLELGGHQVVYAARTQRDLRFDEKRVARMVEKDSGDAWVILAGGRPILEWFAAQEVPALALFGRHSQLPMASITTRKPPTVALAVRHLYALGHRRIVMLSREERRKPTIAKIELRFLEELASLGIKAGSYNLPDWQDHAEGFHLCLDSLFRHTPPTAIFVDEPSLFFAALQYLSRKGIVVPRDVSLIAMEGHPAFEWFRPAVCHLRVNTRPCVPRVLEWIENIAKGKQDKRNTFLEVKFIEGGTIGPARD